MRGSSVEDILLRVNEERMATVNPRSLQDPQWTYQQVRKGPGDTSSTPEVRRRIYELRQQGATIEAIRRELGVSVRTVTRWWKVVPP